MTLLRLRHLSQKGKKTLKQIICCCFFNLTHILEISRFEAPVSKFFWTFFFKTSRFTCDGGWKVCFVCSSCVTRRDACKWRSCSQATPGGKSVRNIFGFQQRDKTVALEVSTEEFFLLFLTSNMTALASRANQQ